MKTPDYDRLTELIVSAVREALVNAKTMGIRTREGLPAIEINISLEAVDPVAFTVTTSVPIVKTVTMKTPGNGKIAFDGTKCSPHSIGLRSN